LNNIPNIAQNPSHTPPPTPHTAFEKQKRPPTATCDKAGAPNDVCPCGQVMSASPDDVAFGGDAVPTAQWANITSLATFGSNIITNEVSNITFA